MKNNTDFKKLSQILKNLKIKKGDNLYLSLDSFKAFSIIAKKPELKLFKFYSYELLRYMKKKVGPNGNILIPVFCTNISKTKTFNRSKTKSNVGLIGNYLLERYFRNRTYNPFYSFLIFGKHKKELLNYKNVGATELISPWKFIIEKNYKIFSLGIHYARSLTVNHYFEQSKKVKYRYIKNFMLNYLDFNKKKYQKIKFNFLVRKKYCQFSGITSFCEKMFLKKKIALIYKHNNYSSYILHLNKASKYLIQDIESSKNNLLYFRGTKSNPKKVLNKDDFYDLENKKN